MFKPLHYFIDAPDVLKAIIFYVPQYFARKAPLSQY